MSMPVIECKKIDLCCAGNSLVQSIALEETALSHILNAEGEKIQKILAQRDCCAKDILEVNRSVESMVDKITALEIVLKSKLELVLPILEECSRKPKPFMPECENDK